MSNPLGNNDLEELISITTPQQLRKAPLPHPLAMAATGERTLRRFAAEPVRAGAAALYWSDAGLQASRLPATETGVALMTARRDCWGTRLHSQMAMHQAAGGVVPELASRRPYSPGGAIGGELPGRNGEGPRRPRRHRLHARARLAGALLVGAAVTTALRTHIGQANACGSSLEAQLWSPLLGDPKPRIPVRQTAGFGGGHTHPLRGGGGRRLHAAGRYPRRCRRRSVRQDRDPSRRRLYQGSPALAKLPRLDDRARSYCRGR